MFGRGTAAKPPPDNADIKVVKTRHGRALVVVIIAGVGILVTVGMLIADVYYSALPLLPITVPAVAWIMGFFTTPVEVAGAYFLTPAQRADNSKMETWFWAGMLALAFIYDIFTNVWGLIEDAARRGADTGATEVIGFAIIAGLILSFAEYFLAGFVGVFMAHKAEYDVCEEWMQKRGSGRPGAVQRRGDWGQPHPMRARATPATASGRPRREPGREGPAGSGPRTHMQPQ